MIVLMCIILRIEIFFISSATGLVNGVPFDEQHVLIKSMPQNITGKKTFVQDGNNYVNFSNMELKGHINGVQLMDMIENQVT